MILSVSVLAANFGRLASDSQRALDAGARWLHIDVMDGHFVPNITMGPVVVRGLQHLKEERGAFLDVHLMIEDPDRYLDDFAAAGADLISVHVEACRHLHRTIQRIHDLGMKAGAALNPATPLSAIEEILPDLDLVLVMSVNPGFAGQAFIPGALDRIRRLSASISDRRLGALLEVDGGIKPENAGQVLAAGADVLVAGSAVFGNPSDIEQRVRAFLETGKGPVSRV